MPRLAKSMNCHGSIQGTYGSIHQHTTSMVALDQTSKYTIVETGVTGGLMGDFKPLFGLSD
jgi:hypothetical protein